jgi:hypothetical protein
MKLTYRGVRYDAPPSPDFKMGPVVATGVYRGAPVTFRALAEMPEQPSYQLTWRGVPYQSGPTVGRGEPTGEAVTSVRVTMSSVVITAADVDSSAENGHSCTSV